MIDLETDVKRVYYKCSNCENKGEAIWLHYKGGVNDKGGFILKCNTCNSDFFLELENPNPFSESRIVSHNFKIVQIIDYENTVDKQLIEVNYHNNLAREILLISGQEEMPILKDSWNTNPEFIIDKNDDIFICSKCKANIEVEAYKDIDANIALINSKYKSFYSLYLKGYINPQMITYKSFINCEKCNNKLEYTAFAKYNGRGEIYTNNKFYLSNVSYFKPNINGVYTKKQSKRYLEKFVLRWGLIASNILIVSPFIGLDMNTSIRKPDKFIKLLEWFLTLNLFDKTQVLVRKTEYNKIKEVIGIDFFNNINKYGLINNIIEKMNSTTPRFHAKFYAGVIPNGEDSYVELLTGSYNLHEESQSMENLIFVTISIEDFEKQYLEPLKLEIAHNEYDDKLEILRIQDKKGKIIYPKGVSDIL